ncbi:MAG: prepilin-type N-terminal cleavage/methylation domain-containing protein, partial [Spirochaetes bacterium]|nr:prepilin-type N-terminal cleavage/methylation domain-containing protein [Spirochaetota bacterium]
MKKIKQNKGFSFVELMVVIALITILSAVAIPSITKFYRTYKYIEYTSSMENLVRWAKMTAIERSINVGLCVDTTNKRLRVVNMGTNRTGICTGTDLNTLNIEHDFVSIAGSGSAFDPRGFAIFTGDVCLSDGNSYYKSVISRFGAIRIEKGSG